MKIEFDTEEMIDAAIGNIKAAMGRWAMETVSFSSKKDGYVVMVAVKVSDGQVDAVTFGSEVILAFEIHTCESLGKNTRWLIYVDNVDVTIKHDSRIIAEEGFDIDYTNAIANFIKKHIV